MKVGDRRNGYRTRSIDTVVLAAETNLQDGVCVNETTRGNE